MDVALCDTMRPFFDIFATSNTENIYRGGREAAKHTADVFQFLRFPKKQGSKWAPSLNPLSHSFDLLRLSTGSGAVM